MYLDGGVQPSPEIRLTPKNYKNVPTANFDESLSLSGYPCIAWASDVFTTWLAQNAYNIPINIGTSAVALGIGAATSNPIAIVSGAMGVASEMASIATHALMPDQARGQQGASANIGMNIMNFYMVQKSITKEQAARLDKYFDMYGYKQHKVETPTFTREHWDYIKTIDCNIVGNIPGPDMEELKALYNNGITLWKVPSEIGNYALNNYSNS